MEVLSVAILNVSPFDSEAHRLLCQALVDAALTQDDLADIVNVGGS